MTMTSDNHLSPEIEAVEPRESRGGIFRRLRAGRAAGDSVLPAAVAIHELDLEDPEYLLGMEDSLTAFVQAKEHQDQIVAGFLNDPEKKECFGKLVSTTMRHDGSRKSQRTARAWTDRDFGNIAACHVMSARLSAVYGVRGSFKHAWVIQSNTTGARDVVGSGRTIRQADALLDQLTLGPPDYEHDTETRKVAEETHGIFHDFQNRVKKAYSPVLEQQGRILGGLNDRLKRDPGTAIKLLGVVENIFGGESKIECALLRVLATAEADAVAPKVLSRAIEMVEAQAAEGALVDEFIGDLQDKPETTLSYLIRELKTQLGVDVSTFLKGNYEEWPQDLQKEYSQFTRARIGAYKTLFARVKDRYIAKELRIPTPDEFEQFVGRVSQRVANTGTKSRVVNGGTAVQSVIGADALQPAEMRQPLEVRSESGETDPREIVIQLLDKKYHNNQQLIVCLGEVVGELAMRYDDRGVRAKRASIDGKKLYAVHGSDFRITSKHDGQRFSKSRVIFTRQNGTVMVHGIFVDHEDYYRYVHALTK